MSNKVIYRRPTTNTYLTGTSDNARGVLPAIYEGLVVDVILNHMHPEYSRVDGHNVGTVKVRIFDVNHGADNSQLSYAFPIDPSMSSYPLIGELVLINKIRGNYYYSSKVAVIRRLQENALIGLNSTLNNQATNNISTAVNTLTELESQSHKFGTYFKPDSRVRPLMHFEGDTILQGRMGHSIRFGSSQIDPSSDSLAPNIILRAGQAKNSSTSASLATSFGLIVEDINKDASSIWMVSDQAIPFMPSTKQAGSFVRSITIPPLKFDKAQVIINSDRVVLNSKKESIMLFSNNQVNINSFENTTIDTDGDIILTANREINFKTGQNIESITNEDFMIFAGSDVISVALQNTSLISKKIYIGSGGNDAEPMVGGTSLSKFLARLIHALVNGKIDEPPSSFTPGPNQSAHVITSTGPALLAPAVVSALQSLYDELTLQNSGQENNQSNFSGASFNSTDNFVMLQNETPEIVKNEFKSGTQSSTETDEWLLFNPYYRVT